MDILVLSSTINNCRSLGDIFEPCLRILYWLQKTSVTSLCQKDLQIIFKGVLYVKACLKIFGNEFKNELKHKYSKRLIGENVFENLRHADGIVFACEQVLKSNCGVCHAFFIEKLLQQLFKEELNLSQTSIESNMYISYDKETKDNRFHMIVILQRLFEVHFEQVDNVIEQLLKHIEFKIIGHIFLEPESSPYHIKCGILEHKICSLIENRRITFSFFRSIYVLASTSDNGLQFFVRSLKNEAFSKCLAIYFTYYLRCTISELYGGRKYTLHPSFRNFYLPNMIFLIKSILINSKINSNILLNLKKYLNMVCSVYEY